MSLRLIACLFALLIAVTRADAIKTTQGCEEDEASSQCREAALRRKLQDFGLEPIETHREAGDQVRRAIYVDGYGNDVVAIAFVRPLGRDPVVRIHSRRWEEEGPIPPLEAPVSLQVWKDLLRRSAHFDRALASEVQGQGVDEGEQSIALCIHGWNYTVEATDPVWSDFEKDEVRRKTENACDDGLVEVLAQEIVAAAIPLFAPCAVLDATQYRHRAFLLRSCARLRGDKLAAAEVANRVDAFYSFRANRFETLAQANTSALEESFLTNAVVDWNGERNGETDPVPFLISKLADAEQFNFDFQWSEGERLDRVRITGTLDRTIKSKGRELREERAPVEQFWKLHGDKFYLESMKVGAFGPIEARSD